jgi:transcriptional regulator of acetoin/glycerol metabolism
MDQIRALGQARLRAQANAQLALDEAYDKVQAAYEAGERVNVKQVAALLGVTRQEVYRELDRRNVDRLKAA